MSGRMSLMHGADFNGFAEARGSLPVRPRPWQGYRPSIYRSVLHRLRDGLSRVGYENAIGSAETDLLTAGDF